MLRFRVLGAFEVVDDRGAVQLGSERRRALLALLTLNAGRVVGVDRLVDALWGDSPPRTAVHVVEVYVSDLRRALPAGVLATSSPGYVLRVPPDAVDLHAFEGLVSEARVRLAGGDPREAAQSLTQALALWRGPVLQDLADEGFVRVEALRLEELRLEARELWAAAVLELGGTPDLVPELRRLVEEHPFRERAHALLMAALASEGRQAEALQVYTSARQRLADELGIEPGAELRAAQVAVLRQEPGSGPRVGTDAEPSSVASGTTAVPDSRGVVLGLGWTGDRVEEMTRTAGLPAAGAQRELVIALVLDATWTTAAGVTTAAAAATAARDSVSVPSRSAVFRSRDRAGDVAAFAAEHDADLVVLDALEAIGATGRLADWLISLLAQLTGDVALVTETAPAEGSVFAVPFGGTDHDWAAAELAALLAKATGSSLRVVGALHEEADASRLVARLGLAVQRAIGVTVEPVLAETTVPAMVAAMEGATPVVGLSERWQSEGLGRFRRQLVMARPGSLVVRRGVRPGLLAHPVYESRFAWSMVVDPAP